MSARLTLYDGATAVEIRIATTAGDDVRAQAEQLRDDLNAFVAAADPFTVVASDSTLGDHVRVELANGWCPGDADWELLSAADGVLYLRARSAAWLARAVARLSWSLGKRLWLPNDAFRVQPTYPKLSVEIDIAKAHDVQDTGAFGTSGRFLKGPLETNFPEWQRVNMVGPVAALRSGHIWQGAVHALGPDGSGDWNSSDHYVEAGKRLQVYRQDPPGTYSVCEDFAAWLKAEKARLGWDSVSVSTTDGTKGWESVVGFGRDDGDPSTYNETEINVFLAKKVAEYFAANQDPNEPPAQISMLAYGSTSYPADPGKADPEGDAIRLPAGLHVVVTKGFFQGNEDWNSVHDSYRAISDDPGQQFSGYWYMEVWTGSKDRPGVAAVSREEVIAGWWADNAPRVTDNYPLYVGGELGSGLCPTFLGALIWQAAWRERSNDFAGLAGGMVCSFLQTCFPTKAVRTAMRAFTERVLWIERGSFAPLLTEDLLHRMYADLLSAIDAGPTAEERARVNAFVKYTRFLELYRAVLAADLQATAGLDLYDEFRAFLYNIRYEGLVNYHFWTLQDAFGADADLEARYGENSLFSSSLENLPDNVPATWRDGGTYFPDLTDGGLRALCVDGMANNALYPFTAIGYPDDPFDGLVEPLPATAAPPATNRADSLGWYDSSEAVTLWVKTKTGQTSLDWWFRPWVAPDPGAEQTVEVVDGSQSVVASRSFSAAADGRVWTNWVATGLQENSVYQVRIKDPRKDGMLLCWWLDGDPDGSPNDISGTYLVSFRVLPAETQAVFTGSPQWFFYVPAGATELGGVWSKKEGEIRDAGGVTILDKDPANLDSGVAPFHHLLDPAQKNTVMRGVHAGGDLTLMTLPPYLALDPRELIVPPSAV